MSARTIWGSLALRRFLLTRWPWRGLAYVLSTPLAAIPAAVPLAMLCLPWLYLLSRFPVTLDETVLAVLAGLLLITAAGPLVALPVARLERLRLRLVHNGPVRGPHPAAGWKHRYTSASSWRELGYLVALVLAAVPSVALILVMLMILSLIISPLVVAPGRPLALGLGQASTVAEALPYSLLGVALIPVALYLAAALASLHAAVAKTLLSGEGLRLELVEVSRSRERLVTAFEAERRRIERDLHDGAQVRLVSLILQLGLAKVEMPPDSPGSVSVAAAHTQAKQLLTELREFIHDIHPQVLSDLGLPAALHDLADRATTPVTVACAIPDRLSTVVESAAYFVVAEALSNAGKHSQATEIHVTAKVGHATLTVEVTDNGRGGADTAAGSGLTGLADRTAAIGGTLSLSSPIGGPTTVRAEFPCGQ
ncbi:sensor histidine kinase [Amycolatopsis sp. cg5]|uniref:sensor histidine kinase n=1 Tax=Amycolatopsis sp. cg5 TaxID=3238802 RepID=UPI0035233277